MSGLLQSLLDDIPREGGALDPHRKFPYPGERFQIAEVDGRIRLLPLHERFERLDEPAGLFHRLALQLLGQHGRGGLADGAALAFKPRLADAPAVQLEMERHLIAAQRIIALRVHLGTGQRAAVARALEVIQDHFSIQLVKLLNHVLSLRRTRESVC